MFQFFDVLQNLLQTIANFFTSVVSTVITFFENIINALGFIISIVAELPKFMQGGLLAILGVSVLAIILSLFVDLG